MSIFKTTLFVITMFVIQTVNAHAYSPAAEKVLFFLKARSDNKAQVDVISETPIPGSDFQFLLLNFKLGNVEKEISFVTNGKYITNALIELETGKNVAEYYEATAKTVSVETSPDELYFGNPDTAKVRIVVFSDFECPYCQKMANELKPIFDKHKKDISIYFKHLPLSFHQNAMLLSEIYEVGLKLGYRWDMYSEDFSGKTNEEIITSYIKKLKAADTTAFLENLGSTAISSKIAKHKLQAEKLGVKGTPYMIINGHPVSGYQKELITQLIETEISKFSK
jgi:protein-disulfide isomerase